jgi:hypothetical protein
LFPVMEKIYEFIWSGFSSPSLNLRKEKEGWDEEEDVTWDEILEKQRTPHSSSSSQQVSKYNNSLIWCRFSKREVESTVIWRSVLDGG